MKIYLFKICALSLSLSLSLSSLELLFESKGLDLCQNRISHLESVGLTLDPV